MQRPAFRFTREELREMEPYPDWVRRPRTRGDCIDEARPCPFVSCKYHLFLDVLKSGNVKINHPGLEVWELANTCALDIVDNNPDGLILDDIADLVSMTRERVRQIEIDALRRLARKDSE